MKVQNAIKKLEKAGLEVTKNGPFYQAKTETDTIQFSRNGNSDRITCISTLRHGLEPDSMTDYFPYTWHDNITQAIKFATQDR